MSSMAYRYGRYGLQRSLHRRRSRSGRVGESVSARLLMPLSLDCDGFQTVVNFTTVSIMATEAEIVTYTIIQADGLYPASTLRLQDSSPANTPPRHH